MNKKKHTFDPRWSKHEEYYFNKKKKTCATFLAIYKTKLSHPASRNSYERFSLAHTKQKHFFSKLRFTKTFL
jgi:hypothetical protein